MSESLMTESESYKYNLCDEHEWAGLGWCPKCKRRIQRQARETARIAKKLGWKPRTGKEQSNGR